MSKIDELIAQYCPDGVTFKCLSDITKSVKTGLNPRKNFKLNIANSKNYYVTVKEITSGRIKFSDKTDKINNDAIAVIQSRSNLEMDDILFSGIGTIGKVAIVDIPTNNWNCSESIFLIKPLKNKVHPRYLMYYLLSDFVRNQYSSQSVGSTLKGVRMATLLDLSIATPPLPVQEAIVEILDKFTALEAELEAELEARTRQYEFYRNELLSFDGKDVEWKTFNKIGVIKRGVAFTKKQASIGVFPVVANASEPICFHNEYNRTGEFVVIARSGANAGLISYWNEELFLTDAFSLHPDVSILNTKFLYYYLKKYQIDIHLMKKGSGVPHVRASDFELYNIPVPSIEEQNRTVAILDKFDALVNDISTGLPAEIKARREQYEYYRGKLLSFEPESA